jgi:hypothetical protein
MTRNRRMLTLWKLSTLLAPLALVAVGWLAVAARIHAQALPFNVRLGLWEVTSTSHSAGVPMPDLSALPPEQRARAEAAMEKGGMGSKPSTHVQKFCLTKEKLEKDLFQEKEMNDSCKRTTNARTASLVDLTFECTGKQQGSGHIHYEAVTPESVTGTMTMKIVMPQSTAPMSINSNMSAKWIGDSCGDVK